MRVIHEACAGLDVHSKLVVACCRRGSGHQVRRETRSFGTFTKDLLELQAWLLEEGVTHVVMEATGVYWKPVWHVLEGSFELVLANAAQVRNVPGRKSDVSDAQWLAELLAHGLVRRSFTPPAPIRDLRELTRTRKQLIRDRSRHVQRIQKTLEDANLKLTETISDVLGASGRAILEALVEGETDPLRLASLGSGRLRASKEVLAEALRGRVTPNHRFLLRLHLSQVDGLDAALKVLSARIEDLLEPFRRQHELLMTVPGLKNVLAATLLSEIGVDMACFPTAQHLVSWAGLCPRLHESAGKRRSTRLRKGSAWLKTCLVQGAWAAVKETGSYESNLFRRIRSRRGAQKAIVAVAASMLTSAYHVLARGTAYQKPARLLDEGQKVRKVQRLTRRLQDLGYVVEIRPAA